MAEKLGLGSEVRELKIGQSFTDPKSIAFHSVRYDFKPASVDTNKKATVDVGNNHQVTVTVPHLDGSGTTQTVFKGSQRPYTKECVLIIDRVTGEMTLEKLGCNIQVKKTRSEYNRMPHPQERLPGPQNSMSSRSATPPVAGSRVSSKTKVTSGSRRPDRPITHLVPKHSPLHASPNHRSPPGSSNSNRREQQGSSNNESQNSHSTLASLPMIGMDDFNEPPVAPTNHAVQYGQPVVPNDKSPPLFHSSDVENGIGEISDSSSSSSDSDSDSDIENAKIPKTNGYTNGNVSNSKTATHLLNEDLCLSESGSDSD